jgi:transcriptional regulator with XRE-family HTH domain
MQQENVTELNFADLLRQLMKQAGHTQQRLSALVGVSHAAVNHWLNKGAIPQGDVLNKLSQIYDVTITGMLHGKAETMGFTARSNAELREEIAAHRIDWRSRALDAETRLELLRHKLAELLNEAKPPAKEPLPPRQEVSYR